MQINLKTKIFHCNLCWGRTGRTTGRYYYYVVVPRITSDRISTGYSRREEEEKKTKYEMHCGLN